MKILQLSKYYPPHSGGIESAVELVSRALAADHDVRVLAFGGDGPAHSFQDGVELIRCPVTLALGSQPLSIRYARQVRAARDWRPDIVHLHTPNPFVASLAEVWLKDFRTVVTHHADIPAHMILREPAIAVQRSVLRRAAAVVCLSEAMAKNARDLRGLSVRTEVIPHGVDPEALIASPTVAAKANELRTTCARAHGLIVFVGRLVGYKGVDVLLNALVSLANVGLLIVGDGPDRPELEALAHKLGIADRTAFLGQVDEPTKAAALHAADVFCLPSITDAEAFGIAQVEAMICGTPVVASRLPTGVTEIAVDGHTALCAIPGDSADLARVIGTLLRNGSLSQRIGDAGRAHANAHYTASVASAAWKALYETLEPS